MKRNFLITTGIKDTWEFYENNFLLDKWCEFDIFGKEKLNGNFCLYPENVYSQLKINDILNIGFSNLNLRIINLKNKILCKVIKNGKLENNKGIHLQNRKIKLNYLTKKDFKAIESGLI